MPKLRLDLLLVSRGLAESRTRAQALIMAGLVYHGEQKLDKAGAEFPDDIELNVRGREHPWVSRGGMKLAKAMEHFRMDVKDTIAMDVGASTGGFTDVLLTNGVAKVYAVDVGHGQLDVKLRNDPRVVVMEETNARHLTEQTLHDAESKNSESKIKVGIKPSPLGGDGMDEGGQCLVDTRHTPSPNPLPAGERASGATLPSPMLDVIVCDASFISLKKVLPAALALAKTGAQLVTLIKPQFEVGKAEVSRGKGVIRDAGLHRQVCEDISAWVAGQGWKVMGITESPITGPKGNVEFLLYARKGE
jgi:23S rRNA (cytidine1920-2'-O)/16S rRNA (cytidine1409-2'-O)-methyltransferase